MTDARRPIYTVAQLAVYLDRCEDTIRSAIKSGDLVARKLGKRTEILDSDAQAWLQGLETVEPVARGAAKKPGPQKTPRARVTRLLEIVPQELAR